MLTDIVSLVRYTLHQDDELVPFRDQVEQRYAAWLSAQQQRGVQFSVEQLQWLTWIKENLAGELGIAPDSFEYTRALVRADLDDFVACYHPEDRHERTETERFRAFSYDELIARDKASLDIFWLRDESLEDTGNLPAPEVIAAEIVEDLQAALEQFAAIATSLGTAHTPPH